MLCRFLEVVVILFLILYTSPYLYAIYNKNYIIAIVNDDVISQHDVENRIDFLMKKLHLSQTPAVRRHLLPQVLRILVDEQLKVQNAKSLHLYIGNSEVSRAISRLVEKQNPPLNRQSLSTFTYFTDFSSLPTGFGLTGPLRTPGYVTEGFFLAQDPLKNYKNQEIGLFKDHLFIEILIKEIRSEIAWHKILQHTVPSQVGESEINTALQALYNTKNQTQNLLAEIVLQVGRSADGDSVLALAEEIVGRIRTGADFKATARQFSQAASATHGGDLGWVLQGHLELEIEKVLQMMQPGQFSMPIRTLSGYNILLLRERRESISSENTLLTLRQLFMPLTGPEALSPQTRSELLEAARMTSSCEAFDALIQQTGTPESGPIGQIRAGDLLPTLRAAVLQLSRQTASIPVPMNGGLAIFMVCDRSSPAPQPDLPSREIIAQQLERAKIETIQYEKLHNLRRAAFIEVRPP